MYQRGGSFNRPSALPREKFSLQVPLPASPLRVGERQSTLPWRLWMSYGNHKEGSASHGWITNRNDDPAARDPSYGRGGGLRPLGGGGGPPTGWQDASHPQPTAAR